jgi:hypothetical protein
MFLRSVGLHNKMRLFKKLARSAAFLNEEKLIELFLREFVFVKKKTVQHSLSDRRKKII